MNTLPAAQRNVKSARTIEIRDEVYRVETIRTNDPDIYEAVSLTKSDGKVYDLSVGSNGCTCDCPDFEYRKGPEGKLCKHLGHCLLEGVLRSDVAIDEDGRVTDVRRAPKPAPVVVPTTVIAAERSRLADRMTWSPMANKFVPAASCWLLPAERDEITHVSLTLNRVLSEDPRLGVNVVIDATYAGEQAKLREIRADVFGWTSDGEVDEPAMVSHVRACDCENGYRAGYRCDLFFADRETLPVVDCTACKPLQGTTDWVISQYSDGDPLNAIDFTDAGYEDWAREHEGATPEDFLTPDAEVISDPQQSLIATRETYDTWMQCWRPAAELFDAYAPRVQDFQAIEFDGNRLRWDADANRWVLAHAPAPVSRPGYAAVPDDDDFEGLGAFGEDGGFPDCDAPRVLIGLMVDQSPAESHRAARISERFAAFERMGAVALVTRPPAAFLASEGVPDGVRGVVGVYRTDWANRETWPVFGAEDHVTEYSDAMWGLDAGLDARDPIDNPGVLGIMAATMADFRAAWHKHLADRSVV